MLSLMLVWVEKTSCYVGETEVSFRANESVTRKGDMFEVKVVSTVFAPDNFRDVSTVLSFSEERRLFEKGDLEYECSFSSTANSLYFDNDVDVNDGDDDNGDDGSDDGNNDDAKDDDVIGDDDNDGDNDNDDDDDDDGDNGDDDDDINGDNDGEDNGEDDVAKVYCELVREITGVNLLYCLVACDALTSSVQTNVEDIGAMECCPLFNRGSASSNDDERSKREGRVLANND